MTNPASGDDTARVDLLPCPFCGGAAKHVRRNDSHETYRFVVCSENSEHRSGNGCYNQAPGRNGDSGKCYKCWNEGIDCVFATKAWNARAAIAAMPAPVLHDLLAGTTAGPVAWIIPGDDNANMNGFIDARMDRDGEFTLPLFAAAPDLVAENVRQAKTIMEMAFEARDNAAEIDALRALVAALDKISPILVVDTPDYAELHFSDGIAHSTQAMTINPNDWHAIIAAYDRAKVAK